MYNLLAKEVLFNLEETLKNDLINIKVLEISKIINILDKQNKLVCIFGNGGSASDAQHFATELVCTYKNRNRKPYKAIALTSDTSIITAWSNDFSYETIFTRQLEAFDKMVGLSIGLSTSGNSENVINALKFSKNNGAYTLLICGEGAIERDFIDFIIKIPSKNTATIQTITQVIYHSICQLLENE